MKSVTTFLFSLIMLLVVTTAKSSERGLFKREIFPTFPMPTTTTTSVPPIPPPTPPTPPPPAPPPPTPAIPTAPTPTVTVTILSTSFLPEVPSTPPVPQVTESNNFSTYVPSTTVEVIKTVAPASNPTDSDSDSYYEGNGNSLIVEGIGIKMSIAVVFLNVFYVLFA